jgi:hypothetical protein
MNMDIEAFREAGAGETCSALMKAIETDGGIAVTGAPFAGRNLLLDHIEQTHEVADRISLSPGADLEDIHVPDGGTVLVEDAHHLYQRAIGGFEDIEGFIEQAAATDAQVITSWNRFAWTYLVQTHDLDRTFPTAIEAPAFSAGQLAALIERLDDRTIVFRDDRDRNDQAIEMMDHEVTVAGRSFTLPVPAINREAIRSWRKSDDPIEEAIFDRIASRSDGNAGVAVALWEESVEDSTINFGNLLSPPDVDVDHEGAVLLNRLITNERMDRSSLKNDVEPLGPVLESLERQNVLRTAGDMVGLEPMATTSVISTLTRRRLLW